MPDWIFWVSWPAFVIRTTMACLWSIHIPALVGMAFVFLNRVLWMGEVNFISRHALASGSD